MLASSGRLFQSKPLQTKTATDLAAQPTRRRTPRDLDRHTTGTRAQAEPLARSSARILRSHQSGRAGRRLSLAPWSSRRGSRPESGARRHRPKLTDLPVTPAVTIAEWIYRSNPATSFDARTVTAGTSLRSAASATRRPAPIRCSTGSVAGWPTSRGSSGLRRGIRRDGPTKLLTSDESVDPHDIGGDGGGDRAKEQPD
jgi:hypothetical protein